MVMSLGRELLETIFGLLTLLRFDGPLFKPLAYWLHDAVARTR